MRAERGFQPQAVATTSESRLYVRYIRKPGSQFRLGVLFLANSAVNNTPNGFHPGTAGRGPRGGCPIWGSCGGRGIGHLHPHCRSPADRASHNPSGPLPETRAEPRRPAGKAIKHGPAKGETHARKPLPRFGVAARVSVAGAAGKKICANPMNNESSSCQGLPRDQAPVLATRKVIQISVKVRATCGTQDIGDVTLSPDR